MYIEYMCIIIYINIWKLINENKYNILKLSKSINFFFC